jgi:hypothetical protein
MNGWTIQPPYAGATISLKNAPPEPVLGKGSLEFSTPGDPVNIIRIRNSQYNYTLLSSITELSYTTYVQNRDNDFDDFFLVLQIDLNGDDLVDNPILFSSRYQTGGYVGGTIPDQGPSLEGVWHSWDLLNGAWWLGPTPPYPFQGGPVFSLASYISQNPTARIINNAGVLGGGIRLSMGAPSGSVGVADPNFRGYVDDFKIGVNGVITVYDFEFTTADAGEDQSVINGYGSNCTSLNGTAKGGVNPYSFSWSPENSSPNHATTEVCPEVTTTYTLTVTDANGCERTDDVTIFVNDVRCGSQLNKVLMCHNGQEICISGESVEDHLDHGDELGGCNSNAFIHPSNPVDAIEIPDQIILTDDSKPFPDFIKVFPNPSNDILYFTTGQDEFQSCHLMIKDMTGHLVMETYTGERQINISTLVPGMYSLQIQSGNRVGLAKVIKY